MKNMTANHQSNYDFSRRRRFSGIIAVEFFLFLIFLSFFLTSCSLRLAEENTVDTTSDERDDSKETVMDNTEKVNSSRREPDPIVPPIPDKPTEKKSIMNLLLTAKEPLGQTMYVWGGGWNKSDAGAGDDAKRIGLSPRWKQFSDEQNSSYNYKKHKYRIHDGLDCSGYIGWVLYNVFESENGKDGYVMKSTDMAEKLAERGFGDFKVASNVTDWKAGDIMSMPGHVWMCLGTCSDSSVLLINASPPGVVLKGVLNSDGTKSKAVELAESYMREYYPDWFERFPDCSARFSYISNSSQMRWNRETLLDNEGLTEKSAEEILKLIFTK